MLMLRNVNRFILLHFTYSTTDNSRFKVEKFIKTAAKSIPKAWLRNIKSVKNIAVRSWQILHVLHYHAQKSLATRERSNDVNYTKQFCSK